MFDAPPYSLCKDFSGQLFIEIRVIRPFVLFVMKNCPVVHPEKVPIAESQDFACTHGHYRAIPRIEEYSLLLGLQTAEAHTIVETLVYSD